jgi:hypothetical protein
MEQVRDPDVGWFIGRVYDRALSGVTTFAIAGLSAFRRKMAVESGVNSLADSVRYKSVTGFKA